VKLKTIKIKCPNCDRKIKILLKFGSSFQYADTRKICPYCNWAFGITDYLIEIRK